MEDHKIIFSMTKRLDSCHELKKIKTIRVKSSKKNESSSRNISISYYDFYLPSDSEWYDSLQPAERKWMNKSDHTVTNNINNKYQCHD